MISIDYGIHLTSKSNARVHWSTRAREARSQRQPIKTLVQVEMRRLTPVGQPWEIKWRKPERRKTLRAVTQLEADMVLSPTWQARLDGGIVVTMTRFAARLLDNDNIRDAFKSVRDGVADAWGVRDNDPRVTWEYAQEKHPDSRVNVRIEWKVAE